MIAPEATPEWARGIALLIQHSAVASMAMLELAIDAAEHPDDPIRRGAFLQERARAVQTLCVAAATLEARILGTRGCPVD